MKGADARASGADPDPAALAWARIEAHLERRRLQVEEEIRNYPAPIPACDAQFNYLLEARDGISKEIGRLRAAARASRGRADALAAASEFAATSPHIGDEAVREPIPECDAASLHSSR